MLNAIFMYDITVKSGDFEVVKHCIDGHGPGPPHPAAADRLQLRRLHRGRRRLRHPGRHLRGLLIGLGFRPLQAAGLSLIGNTAPVAYGALGTPLIALAGVTGLSISPWAPMAGRILPFFSSDRALLADLGLGRTARPCWKSGRRFWWPADRSPSPSSSSAITTAPGWSTSAAPSFPWLSHPVPDDLAVPRRIWTLEGRRGEDRQKAAHGHTEAKVVRAWVPWVFLCVFVFVWGTPTGKTIMNGTLHSIRQ